MDVVRGAAIYQQQGLFSSADNMPVEQTVARFGEALSAQPLQAGQVLPLLATPLGREQLDKVADVFAQALHPEQDHLLDAASRTMLADTATTLLETRNSSDPVSLFQLLELMMQIALRDAERRRDTQETLRPLICATTIALMALGKEALDSTFIAGRLQAVQSVVNGAADLAGTISKVPREGLGRVSTMVEKQAAVQGTSAYLLDSIAEAESHYVGQTTQHLDGLLALDDASHQETSQHLQQLVQNSNRLALIVASGWFISIEGSKK